MKMTNKYFITSLLVSIFILASCDKDFDELNTNPVELTSINPTFQLNSAIIASDYGYNNLTYETTIVKQMITPFIGVGTGGNLNQDNRSATQGNWQDGYRNQVKNLVDGIASVDPEKTNLLSMLRIWKAHAFMVLTDSYGDIPYFEAGRAFLDGTGFPAYDSQESIYADILNELASASAALDPGKDKVAQDIMYGGDIGQWKKLGYSLLLRAAMRLSKADPGKAQQFVGTAVAGGLFASNVDNALIRHNADYRNGVGTNVNGGQAPFYYLDRDFVNWMKSKNDPRLPVIGVRFVGAKQEGDQVEANADRSFDAQIGMPQGYDNTTIPPIVAEDGLQSLYDYSQMDRTRFGNPEAPNFLVTHSQTQLLLAEAIVRGWTSGDAAAAYEAGIRAHMQQCSDWPGNTDVAQADIDAYVAANPLEAGKELELINGQYWMSSYLMGPETWANFRRSGYPIVSPNKHPGSDLRTEDFIRRLTYPDSEQTVNKANLDVAVGRQGPDILDTRVWWDKK
ncbi:MAG: SusD/RagB family nutrient-binding outer membrane lipoprotein [Saprospiraceae bacterium]|nr:SusD/RagB family nutrient-binding outer membrane lipoprotein [Saprospiraceae bacterium]